MELTVPKDDVELIRQVAVRLRQDRGSTAPLRAQLRASLEPPAASGEELLAFFRSSPLTEEDLLVERDRSVGRSVDL